MEEINAFFDMKRDFIRDPPPSGVISGNPFAVVEVKPKKTKRELPTTSYPTGVVEEQNRLLSKMTLLDGTNYSRYGAQSETVNSRMDELDAFSDNNDTENVPMLIKVDDPIYTKYNFERHYSNRLTIDDYRQQIVETIRTQFVTIVEGNTGCGKTTQVPQYILDDAYRCNDHCKIVCTQPRRIAAISIAQRVSDERDWPIGSIVGYKVGLHANVSDDTRIFYCTTGVLLQKLIKEKTLTSYTHIILDEVHDRDQDMDFLLIIIRKFLSTNSQNVKIILMSATINAAEFADYFKIQNVPAPVLRVDKCRQYTVSEFYFDDLARINSKNFEIDYNEPGISNEMYNIALKLIIVLNNIEKKETVLLDENKKCSSILIFLPGINEIDMLFQKLILLKEASEQEIKMMPIRLHSLIPPDEQRKIFDPVMYGYRKVILATNIAESSITVPDVKFVIDFCLTKSLITDTATSFTSLQLHWASRANCRQRAGRAGRVMHGRVYRMVDKYFYEKSMAEFSIPEMLRCPLQNVILKTKLLDIDTPRNILALAMTPPNMCDVFNTILTLKEAGALFRLKGGKYNDEDGELTFMGRVMASMPLDIRLTRLILFGYIFSCLEDVIIIAAGLSVRSIFKFNIDNKTNEIACHIQKLTWSDGSGSDLIAILTAYRVWTSVSSNNSRDREAEISWSKRYNINLRCIKEMHLLVLELKDRLLQFNIKNHNSHVYWLEREKVMILKVIISGAFYPNYFTRSKINGTNIERSVYNTLSGHDPCSTVYFTNFHNRHIGQLYTRSIKELFRNLRIPSKNIDVRFDSGSQRVLISFKSDVLDENDDSNGIQNLIVPGIVRSELYKAIRMRMLHMRTTIRVMEPAIAINYALQHGIGEVVEGVWQPLKHELKDIELSVVPCVFQKTVYGYITHVETCNKFYFQSLAEIKRLRKIHKALNSDNAVSKCKFGNPSEIAKGMILAAPFDNNYNRACVLQVISSSSQTLRFKILFIDYGHTAIVEFEKLRFFSHDDEYLINIPPLSLICRLALIYPSLLQSLHGKWAEEANESIQNIANSGKVEIEIYSFVEGVANVILRVGNKSLNEILVEKKIARYSDESFLSRLDHDYRIQMQSDYCQFNKNYILEQNEKYRRSIQKEVDEDVAPPPPELCTKIISLRGPFSPLETKIYSVVKAGYCKTILLERDSVNSVLLDTDPHDLHDRFIVGTDVTETNIGDSLTVRSTTLMPNIHGFGALMTLLFCPTMQLKTDSNCTKYVSILAGLGYDTNTMTPLFEDHDMIINLDIDLMRNDIELINHLRYCMNTILFTAIQDEERPQISDYERGNMMAKIKDLIIRLLNMDHKFIEPYNDHKEYGWEDDEQLDMIRPNANIVSSERYIFPLHSIPRLYNEKSDRIHALRIHCEELHKMTHFNVPIENVKCLLCNQSMDNIVTLRIHLLSQLHRDRESSIGFTKKIK